MRPFITPNLHVILIHFPLGLLSLGLLMELLSFMWRKGAARIAGRYMILLGALACVPATTSGIYALRYAAQEEVRPRAVDAVSEGSSWSQTWADAHMSDAQYDFLRWHVINNGIGTLAVLFAAIGFLACSDRWRKMLYLPFLLIALGGMFFLTMGAWHGGETVYRHGTSVEQVADPAHSARVLNKRDDLYKPWVKAEPATQPQEAKADAHEHEHAKSRTEAGQKIADLLPPGEAHTFLAGLVVALSAVAFGLTMRASTWTLPPPGDPRLVNSANQYGRNDWTPGAPVLKNVASARFWIVAALFAIATAVAGFWFAGALSKDGLENAMKPEELKKLNRDNVHVILGVGAIIFLFLLGLLAKVAARKRIFLFIISLIYFAAAAAQVWIGVLMLLDSNVGPQGNLFKFKTASAATMPVEKPEQKQPEQQPAPAQPNQSSGQQPAPVQPAPVQPAAPVQQPPAVQPQPAPVNPPVNPPTTPDTTTPAPPSTITPPAPPAPPAEPPKTDAPPPPSDTKPPEAPKQPEAAPQL